MGDETNRLASDDIRGLKDFAREGHLDLALKNLERNKHAMGNSSNRLKYDIEDLQRQRVNNVSAIKRDQKILRQELHMVKNTSGHSRLLGERRHEARKDREEIRNFQEVRYDMSRKSNRRIYNQDREASTLPLLTRKQRRPKKKSITEPLKVQPYTINATNEVQTNGSKKDHSSEQHVAAKNKQKEQQPLIDTQLQSVQSSPRFEHSLSDTESWSTNMNEARSNIKTRLSTCLNEVPSEKATSNTNETDLDQYMYPHPDGTPRTMYIMPSFDARFQQAMKARYIRKPGTKLDPIDKELDLDAIFNRKSKDL